MNLQVIILLSSTLFAALAFYYNFKSKKKNLTKLRNGRYCLKSCVFGKQNLIRLLDEKQNPHEVLSKDIPPPVFVLNHGKIFPQK